MKDKLLLLIGAIALTVSSVAAESDKVWEMHEEIQLKKENLVNVEIDFGVGELRLGAGSGDLLLDADVEYSEEDLKPEISYEAQDSVGRLHLRVEEMKHIRHPWRSLWDLKFTDKIPLTFDISIGANKGELDFTGLRVRDLEINTGASSSVITFDKPNPETLERIEISAGAARVRLKNLGNANFKSLDFQGGAGIYILDFRGSLEHKASVDISMGIAQLTLLIPKGIGAKIRKDTPLTSFSIDGFREELGYYVNESFGKTEGTLIVNIKSGLGSINVETVE